MYEMKGLARHHKERTSSGHARAGRSIKAPKRPYVAGESVLFQREPGLAWEPGSYVRAESHPVGRGWHFVTDRTGKGHLVPNRRLKAAVPEA
jgi:hypothetical protein